MTLHVEIRGHGPDLVLLHGWALHGGMWGPWLDELARHARLHIVDLPGHGRSPWAVATQDLAGVARAVFPCVPQRAAVLGWSLGGMLALELARQHPRHLGALLLVATTPKFLAGPDWEQGLPPAVLGEGTLFLLAGARRERKFVYQIFQGCWCSSSGSFPATKKVSMCLGSCCLRLTERRAVQPRYPVPSRIRLGCSGRGLMLISPAFVPAWPSSSVGRAED